MFQGSCSKTKPDFSAASSPTNQWTYIQVKNRDTDTAVNGATGITYTGTDGTLMELVNVDALEWVGATISSWTAGKVTLELALYNNA